MKWLDSIPPAPPEHVRATVIDRFVRLRWQSPEKAKGKEETYGFVVYRFEENESVDLENGANIIGVNFKPESFFFDTNCEPGQKYRYVVRAMDRVKNLSAPSSIMNVVLPD